MTQSKQGVEKLISAIGEVESDRHPSWGEITQARLDAAKVFAEKFHYSTVLEKIREFDASKMYQNAFDYLITQEEVKVPRLNRREFINDCLYILDSLAIQNIPLNPHQQEAYESCIGGQFR